MSTRNYSADQIEVAWFGLNLKPGLAAGTFLVPTVGPRWIKKVTGMGSIVRQYQTDESGSISITIDQESSVAADLRLLVASDKVLRNIVGSMIVRDTSSGTVCTYVNAYIAMAPPQPFGNDAQVQTWVWDFESVSYKAASNNFVGS